MEPDRGLPDAFDQIEHVGTLLVAYGIAENTPEQADIGPQPGIFFQSQRFVGAVGPDFGLGRHDLGRHGSASEIARQFRVCKFFAAVQDKDGAAMSGIPVLRSGLLAGLEG